jgi:hypothetical protein
MSYAAGWAMATQLNGLHMSYAAEWSAFSAGLNGDGFFSWVEWGRLFQMG